LEFEQSKVTYYGENGTITTNLVKMPLDEILADLLARTGGDAVDDANSDMSTEMTDSDGVQVSTADRLVLALEKLVNSKYRDPGTGIHFVGLLLTLFAAEMVSTYWRREGHSREAAMTDPPRMLSTLYSNDFVAFLLSHPTEVASGIRRVLTSGIQLRQTRKT
jgi:hypothetical protein